LDQLNHRPHQPRPRQRGDGVHLPHHRPQPGERHVRGRLDPAGRGPECTEFNQVLYGIQEAWDQTTNAINADRVQVGLLPAVTAPDNGKVLQVSAGAWAATTMAAHVATIPVNSSLSTAGSQLSVVLATNGGLVNASGVKIAPADGSLVLSASGVNVQNVATGGISTAAGGLFLKAFQSIAADGSPAEGDVWYNTVAKSHRMQNAGALTGGVVECVFRQTADSNAVGNTTTQTIFNQTFTIPANFLTVGKTLRVRFGVAYTTNAVNTTAAIACWLNGLAGTNLGGLTTSTFTNAVGRFEYEIYITCRSTGAGGTIHVSNHALGNDNAYGFNLTGDDTATLAINTTISNTLALSFQWGAANASNVGTQRAMTVEVLNP
jgi:hypothetical protein